MNKFLAIAALLGMVSAVRIQDNSDPLGRNPGADNTIHQDMVLSNQNGADEDEIMDNIYSKWSKEGQTPSGHKTGQKLLLKDDAKIAAGQVLEAAHRLYPHQVPAYLKDNFDRAWDHFDQNHEGWIRYEETHTFQRYLNGRLNGFRDAPGSIMDLASGGITYPLTNPPNSEAVPVG